MQNFQYNFNVGGDYSTKINNITDATGKFSAKVGIAMSSVEKWAAKFAVMDLVSNYVQKFNDALGGLSKGGISLDSQMHDLSAIAGVTGQTLKDIEGYARASAKTFGTDASVAVEGYKLLLSQLSPELGKYPDALQSMGNSIQTTSKLMANDGTAAAEVLTTAMNQYGISLKDPTAASKAMSDMMNVMAAAGQEGSAELPAIKLALEQCGMAAKSANVSFQETNAAIQVLDKAGKKGAEGGVAIRNMLAIMSQGRFLPDETQKALHKAGVDLKKLGDTSLDLKTRLTLLKPILNDSALFTKLFGLENANAARALVQGRSELGRLTKAITGTKSAEEQAAIVMDSYAERQNRVNQMFENYKISIFQATGDTSLWVGTIVSALVPVSQLMPLVMGVGNAMMWVKSLQWASMFGRISTMIRGAAVSMVLLSDTTGIASRINLGFFANITRSTIALLRFSTVGIWSGIKALGAFLISLVTTGTASATFSTIASVSFSAFKLSAVSACRAVGIAIMNIPIIGWIAAAVAALIAIGVYFWNTSAKFRAILKGIWASFKAVFVSIGDLARVTFGAIGDLMQACFTLSPSGITSALNKLKGGFSNFGQEVGKAFNNAYAEEMKASQKKDKVKSTPQNKTVVPDLLNVKAPTVPDVTGGTTSRSRGGGDGSGKIRNVTVNVGKLVEKLEIHTTNLKEGTEKAKDAIVEALLSALNDTNLETE